MRNSTKEKIINLIKTAKSIVIAGHVHPDGDLIGSMIALELICRKLNNKSIIDMITVDGNISIYEFHNNTKLIQPHDSKQLQSNYDLALCIDCATKERLDKAISIIDSANVLINIDHHKSNTVYGDLNFIIDDASSTGEIIYEIFNPYVPMSKEIAEGLYIAILTDTGGFKFSNTSAKSLEICSDLIKKGADPCYLYQHCYENKPLEMVKLHNHCMNNLKTTNQNKLAWSYMTKETLKQLNAKEHYSEGIVESLRQINSVEIAIFLRETTNNDIKASLRSKSLDISKIAEKFGGGGHTLAAGCTIETTTIEEAIKKVVAEAQKMLE